MTATAGATKAKKGYKGLGMEGGVARWYARNTGNDLEPFRRDARAIAEQLAPGSRILEVAPGPGFLAVELAKQGPFEVTGLDISKTFVELATENARQAGVHAAFHVGNASEMPFESDAFDYVVCRAAFKNFSEPVRAIAEMHRVLKPRSKAVIIDLRPDASTSDITSEVARMKLSRWNAILTTLTFKHMLLKRAYTKDDFRRMAAQTPFKTCSFREEAITLEISLTK